MSDQREAPEWMREALRGPHRRPARARRGARRGRRLHARDPPGGDRRRDRQLPQAPAHAARGEQRPLQRGLPRGARRAGRALRVRVVVDGVRARDRVPDHRGAPARLPGAALGLRLLEARRRGLLPRAHDEHGLPYTICRPFNAYGPGEMPDDEPGIAHVVPDLIRKVLAGPAAAADLRLGRADAHAHPRRRHRRRHRDRDGAPGGRERGLQHLGLRGADRRRDRARSSGRRAARTRPSSSSSTCRRFEVDVQRRWPSVEKAERLLGWEARIGVREGIADTVGWLRGNRKGGRPMSCEARADHRHHRPGRLLPGRAAAREGLRGARHGPPLLDRDVRAPRAHPRRPHAAHRATCSTSARSSTCCALRAGRDLQPRRDVVRGRLLDPADADGGVHRRRRHADARGDARGRARGALLPGVLVARCSARCSRCPQTETTPFYPRSPYGVAKATATSSPSTTASPTTCSLPRGSSSTTRAPRRGLEFVTRKVTHARGRDQARARRTSCALGNLDAERDWGYAQGLRRGDVADAPAGRARRLRDRHRRDAQRPRAGRGRLRPRRARPRSSTCGSTTAFLRPAEVDHLVGDATKAEREARLGAAARASRS